MDSHDARNFIDAYIDGELDLVKSLEVEQHLQSCAACSRIYQNRTALRTAVKESASLYYKAPDALSRRVAASMRRSAPAPRMRWWAWLSALAAVVVVTFGLTRVLFTPSAGDLMTQAVIASHVRSQITNHQVDVVSSDQHTVKPWFNGKLDFSPTVVDLSSQGYPLVGGRLDYLNNRSVAALVYRRQQHLINLFIWPATGAADSEPKTEMRQGYNLAHWTESGMDYWAVTDLNETEFHEFVRLARLQIAQAAAP